MAKYYHSTDLSSFKGIGHELEDEMISVIGEYFVFKGERKSLVCKSGSDDDIKQGTDCIIYGVPVDVTANFYGKDNMSVLSESIDLIGGLKVEFGVRTGNSYKGYTPFETSVLVIGITGGNDSLLGRYMASIMASFREVIEAVIEVGQSQYWDWMDLHCPA